MGPKWRNSSFIFDGDGQCDDEWGLDLAGPEQAYLEAVSAARANVGQV